MKINVKVYGFLLGALAVAALMFGACGDNPGKPEIQLEDGYARVKINLVGEEVPLEMKTISRTTFPDLFTDVTYEYYFTTKGEDGKYPAAAAKDLVKPNTDNEFLLEPGEYQVTVKAYDKSTYTIAGPNKMGAQGTAIFSVPFTGGVTTVPVSLVADTASSEKGIISIAIDYPSTSAAAVTLTQWVATNSRWDPVTLSPTNGNGTYKAKAENLEKGYYKLTVSITEGSKSAGTIEAIHVYPNLTTTYRKTFKYTDLSDPITIKKVELTIPESRQGMTRATDVDDSSLGPFRAAPVVWEKSLNGTDFSPMDTSVFTGNCTYKVTITLTANTGYNFAGLTNKGSTPTATINGIKANLVKADGTENDPIPSGNQAGTIILSYVFPKTKEVSSITIINSPTLAYPHNDKLNLSGLSVRLLYTADSGGGGSDIIPYAKFTEWNIEVLDRSSNALPNETLMVASTYDTMPITIRCNGKTVDTGPLQISKKNMSDSKIVITVAKKTYIGIDLSPVETDVSVVDDRTGIVLDVDYTVSISEVPGTGRANVAIYPNVVTVTGKGDYTGTKTQNFEIEPQDLNAAATTAYIVIKLDTEAPTSKTYKYNGEEQRPAVVSVNNTALAEAKRLLSSTTDYSVTYDKNIEVSGAAEVIINGKGNYTGKKTVTFSIGKGDITAANIGDYLTTTGIWNPAVSGFNTRFIYDGIPKEATAALKTKVPPMTGLTLPGTMLYGALSAGTKPVNVGSYEVKWSTTGANFNDITNLILGNLVIDKADYKREDFKDLAPRVYNGDPQAVSTGEVVLDDTGVVQKDGMGSVSNIRYTYPNSTTPSPSVPRDAGTYPITVKVESGNNFNATDGLVVGQLIIKKKTPMLDDFNINGAINGTVTVPFDGNPKQVIVEPGVTKPGNNQMNGTGNITVKYTNTTTNIVTPTPPSAQGTYWITFDVAGGPNFEAGVDLGKANAPDAGQPDKRIKLVIGRGTPERTDFVVSPTSVTYDGTAKAVTVTSIRNSSAKPNSMGAISNITYNDSPTVPINVGTYTIKVNVALGDDYDTATGITVGWLEITKRTPVAGDFTITGPGTNGSMTVTGDGTAKKAVTIVPKSPMTNDGGVITIKYTKGSTTITSTPSAPDSPAERGAWTVTFDVNDAGASFNEAKGLSAGTLNITAP